MPKKLKSETDGHQQSEGVFDSAHHIWLAGLGAFIRAQEEGGKLFESLVKEGADIEARSKREADETAEEVRNRVRTVRGKTTDSWSRLEHVFQDRISRSLHNLGVPTRDDIMALSERIETLGRQIKSLREGKPREKTTAGSKTKPPAGAD